MKAAIVLVFIFTVTIFLTGCGHYGMGQHYIDNYNPRPPEHEWEQYGAPGFFMNGNVIQSQGTYG